MRYAALFLSLLFVITGLFGCNKQQTAAPVDVEVAQETLERVLEEWKAGAKTTDLQKGTPSVVVQDRDWQQGVELVDYEIAGPGDAQDANLICDVQLTLRGSDGTSTEKTVTYIVGTDPVLTVFRKVF